MFCWCVLPVAQCAVIITNHIIKHRNTCTQHGDAVSPQMWDNAKFIWHSWSVDLWIASLSKIYSQSLHGNYDIVHVLQPACFYPAVSSNTLSTHQNVGWVASRTWPTVWQHVQQGHLMHSCPQQARLQAPVFFSWQISERGSKQLHKTLPLWHPTLFQAGILQANLANYTQVWC